MFDKELLERLFKQRRNSVIFSLDSQLSSPCEEEEKMPPKKKKKKSEKRKKKRKKKSGKYSDSSGSESETVYPSDLQREEKNGYSRYIYSILCSL